MVRIMVGLAEAVRLRAVGVITAGLTVMVKTVKANSPPGSVAVMVTLLTPVPIGVPCTTRVAGLKLKLLAGLIWAV